MKMKSLNLLYNCHSEVEGEDVSVSCLSTPTPHLEIGMKDKRSHSISILSKDEILIF